MNRENKTSAIESFKTDPISKIVIKSSIPALIAMMMVMVYNLADTFFLGLTHNDLQVTAVSLATPLFMIFMSLGVDGLIWAQPIADVLSLAVVIIMLWRKIKKTDFAKPDNTIGEKHQEA